MAVDPSLSLQTKQPDVATPINQAANTDQADALNTEQVLKAHYDNLGERDKQRLQSSIVGAAQLKTYLDKGDVEGAHDFLVQRQAALHQRMGAGENVDTQETDYALDKLRRGDVQSLQNDVNSLVAAGQAYGMVGGQGTPSSVQEWNYYHSLPKDQQDAYLTMKRANPAVNIGGASVIPSQANPGGAPQAVIPHTLKPEDQPTNAFNKSEADAKGSKMGAGEGEAGAKLADLQSQLPRLNQVVDKLHQLGQTATYTKAGQLYNDTARQLGADVPKGGVDLAAYNATVDNEVLPLLRQTFGAAFTEKEGNSLKVTLGDPNKSPPEKDAVLRAFIDQKTGEVQSLQRRTGQAAQPAAPVQGGGAAPAAGATGQVKVSNGKETFMINQADLAAAQAEGFQPQ